MQTEIIEGEEVPIRWFQLKMNSQQICFMLEVICEWLAMSIVVDRPISQNDLLLVDEIKEMGMDTVMHNFNCVAGGKVE